MKPHILVASVSALLLAPSLFALNDTWDGGGADNNITTGLNWVDNTAPASDLVNTDLFFDGTVRLTPIFTAPFSADSLTFNNNAAVNAFTFAGSTLTIGTTGIINNDAQTQTFSTTQLSLGTATTTFNAAAGPLAFNAVTIATNTLNFVATTGTSSMAVVFGSGVVNKSGAGTLTFGSAGAATQLWDLVQTAGTFTVNATTDLTVSASGSITVNGGTFQSSGNLTMTGTPIVLGAASPTFNIAAGKTLLLQSGGTLQALADFTHAGGGTITATGATSLITVAGSMIVNDNLNVLAGADVVATTNFQLANGAATASLVVDGSGSTFTGPAISGSFIGNSGGNGTMIVSNTANASFSTLLIAANSPVVTGLLAVQSGGAVTASNLVMADDAATSQNATLTVDGAGSSFSLTGTGSNTIGSGSASIANVNVQNGGTFSTFNNASFNVNATGTVTINGGTFNANNGLTLNGGSLTRNATGAFAVAAGKTLTVQNAGTAAFTGAQDFPNALTLSVSGAGSQLSGTAALTFTGGVIGAVSSGGNLAAQTLTLGVAAIGNLTVDGTGTISTINVSSSLVLGGNSSGTLTLSNNATGTLSTINVLPVGTGGTGALNIQSGADVTAGAISVAASANAGTGSVTVTGAGSTLSQSGANSLIVGHPSIGTAIFNVSNGAVFSSGTGTTSVNPTGAINITGGTYNANGNMTLSGTGAQLNRDSAGVFNLASGKVLTVQGGADALITGNYSSNGAIIQLTGAGSTFQNTNSFIALTAGSLVNVVNGASFSAVSFIDVGNGSAGTLTAAGAATTVTTSGVSYWGGDAGTANITFSSGATGNLGEIRIARATGVSGAISNVLFQTGAHATSSLLTIASDAIAATGSLTVDGAGTTWTVSGSNTVAIGSAASTGTLNVTNAGAFTSGTGPITVGALGTINIAGGVLTLNGALSFAGTMNFTAGTLSYLDNLTVGTGGLLGTSLNLDSARTLITTATTTIDATRTLTLSGGTLRTGALVNNGTLAFNSGTLGITGAGGFTIGGGGALGANVTLGSGANLQVTNTATVAGGATVTLNGGAFTAGTLTNSGTVRANLGTASATTGTNASGGRIFIGDTLDISGAFTNALGGRITLENGSGLLSGAGTLNNAGLISGDGTIAKPLTNGTTGELRGELGRTLSISGATINSGSFTLVGGTLDFASTVANNAGAFISGHGALFTGGLTNAGQMAFSGGTTDIRGDTTLTAGSRVVTSGVGSTTTFFDDVIHNGLEIFTGAGASTVFYGSQSGAGSFTGTGTVYFIGDLRPGNSPASVLYEGDLVFGGGATLTLELGGLLAGSQYDRLNVAGELIEDGVLEVALYNGFTPHFGDTFDLFDAGEIAGSFDAITLPALSGDLAWDATNLQSTGQLRVVPEPGVGTLLLAALSVLGLSQRQRQQP